MHWKSEKLIGTLFLASVLGLSAFAVVAWRAVAAFQASRMELLRSRAAISDLTAARSLLREATNAMRGYVITGQSDYLDDYSGAVVELREHLKRLLDAKEIDSDETKSASHLQALVERRIAILQTEADLRRSGNRGEAESYIAAGEGRSLDEQVKELTGSMEKEESHTVERRLARATTHANQAFSFLSIALAGNFLWAGVVYVFTRRELRARAAVEAQLEQEVHRTQKLYAEANAASARFAISQELFRKLFENSPDAMILVDKDRRISRANAQAQKVFGWSEPLAGALLDQLLPERFRARHVGHLSAYFQAPRARPMGLGLELYGLRADGTEFPVDILLSPMELAEGVLVLAAIRDITLRREAQAHIERLNHDLEQRASDLEYANKELEAFSYSVSHDLRAPLRHVNGFADMLKSHASGMLDDKGRRYLDTIVDAAKRMGLLIDDLLMFSRMGRSEMMRQPVNLALLVEEAKRAAEREAASRNIQWQIAPLPEVMGDVAMLRQVLFNLVSNAVKYTRDRAEARIEIGTVPAPAGEVICYVRDNGAGFDMKYAHKLFGVFQRLHGPTEFEGTGVGLAIVRRIVQRHGGRVWAEAAVEQGATFFFSLPVSTV